MSDKPAAENPTSAETQPAKRRVTSVNLTYINPGKSRYMGLDAPFMCVSFQREGLHAHGGHYYAVTLPSLLRVSRALRHLARELTDGKAVEL